MTPHEPPRPDRALVRAIEELRLLRRGQVAATGHPEAKRFTQDELCDIYSSYKGLLSGRVRRPPRREMVMQIADYLECTLAQRNVLLAAAHYPPEQPPLEEPALRSALAIARQMLAYLPLPAYIMTRDWDTQGINGPLLTLFGLTQDEVERFPPDTHNTLVEAFDPRLPFRARLSPTPAAWRATAQRLVYGFKFHNQLYQYEPWYRDRVAALHQLPDFAEVWAEVSLHQPPARTTYELAIRSPSGAVVQLRSLIMQLGDLEYPRIVALLPANKASHVAFVELGLTLPTVPWGIRDEDRQELTYSWGGDLPG